jgi:hypothetical protein
MTSQDAGCEHKMPSPATKDQSPDQQRMHDRRA